MTVEDSIVGEIGAGLVIFVCAMRDDTETESEWLARKVVKLRIFRDEARILDSRPAGRGRAPVRALQGAGRKARGRREQRALRSRNAGFTRQ